MAPDVVARVKDKLNNDTMCPICWEDEGDRKIVTLYGHLSCGACLVVGMLIKLYASNSCSYSTSNVPVYPPFSQLRISLFFIWKFLPRVPTARG